MAHGKRLADRLLARADAPQMGIFRLLKLDISPMIDILSLGADTPLRAQWQSA